MQRLINKSVLLANSRIIRTALVGVVSVFFQTIVFELIGVVLKLVSLSTATLIGCEVAIIINFMLNNRFSFGDRPHGSAWVRVRKFHLVVLGSVFIQWVCIYLTEHRTNNLLIIHAVYASSIILGLIWNYNWYRVWVWRHHKQTV